jgi:hypothetical protein
VHRGVDICQELFAGNFFFGNSGIFPEFEPKKTAFQNFEKKKSRIFRNYLGFSGVSGIFKIFLLRKSSPDSSA